jgi:hypothetical protein
MLGINNIEIMLRREVLTSREMCPIAGSSFRGVESSILCDTYVIINIRNPSVCHISISISSN